MAGPKKRKLDDDGGGGGDEQHEDMNLVKEATKRARKSTLREIPASSAPFVTPSENLMMKLPGELRNRIYELVLLTNQTIEIRTRSMPPDLRHSRSVHINDPGKTVSWEKPGLLRVSEQIRAESCSIYYGNNDFTIFTRSGELCNVLDFLLCKSADDGADITLSHGILTMGFDWWGMDSWVYFALIAWYTPGSAGSKGRRIVKGSWPAWASRIDKAVQDVVQLGI